MQNILDLVLNLKFTQVKIPLKENINLLTFKTLLIHC